MIKISAIYYFLFFSVISAGAQSCFPVKIYAFKQRVLPGNISINDQVEGQPDKQVFIYIAYLETSCNKPPQIESSWIDGISYSAAVLMDTSKAIKIGTYEGSGTTAIIKTDAKKYLYKVEFQPDNITKKIPAAYRNKTTNKILLKLKSKEKFVWSLSTPIKALEAEVVY